MELPITVQQLLTFAETHNRNEFTYDYLMKHVDEYYMLFQKLTDNDKEQFKNINKGSKFIIYEVKQHGNKKYRYTQNRSVFKLLMASLSYKKYNERKTIFDNYETDKEALSN